MKRKVCGKCKRNRLVKFFKANPSKKDGLNWQCIDCQSAYHRAHYEKNKDRYIQQATDRKKRLADFIRSLKVKCSRCPETHPAVLDFHHKDPRTKDGEFRKALVLGWGESRILKEVKKCEVLCSNCHRKLHWELRV